MCVLISVLWDRWLLSVQPAGRLFPGKPGAEQTEVGALRLIPPTERRQTNHNQI